MIPFNGTSRRNFLEPRGVRRFILTHDLTFSVALIALHSSQTSPVRLIIPIFTRHTGRFYQTMKVALPQQYQNFDANHFNATQEQLLKWRIWMGGRTLSLGQSSRCGHQVLFHIHTYPYDPTSSAADAPSTYYTFLSTYHAAVHLWLWTQPNQTH